VAVAPHQRDLSEERAAARVASGARPPRRSYAVNWRDAAIQGLTLVAVAAVAGFLVWNLVSNVRQLGVNVGFDFLFRPASFAISQTLIPYTPASTYLDAFVAALLNTVVLSLTCIVAATLLGMAVALARVSSNPTLSGLAATYVEAIRNVPLLLQLLAWYFVVVRSLPTPRNAYSFFSVGFLSNRGLYLPAPEANAGFVIALVAGLAVASAVAVSAWMRKSETGRAGRRLWLIPAAFVGVPLLALATGFADLHWSVPVLRGFNYAGGLKLVPEFIAMTLGLSIYASAFVAEVFRGGINAVGRGQREAGLSLGMRPWLVNWKVVIPLALRVVVPPLGGQYVLLLKNSSLAAAIAYPDLMQVMAGTAVNQTGQPLEVMFITLATYVLLGLMIAAATNLWNYRLKLHLR